MSNVNTTAAAANADNTAAFNLDTGKTETVRKEKKTKKTDKPAAAPSNLSETETAALAQLASLFGNNIKSDTATESRQRDMTIAMFDAPITYSLNILKAALVREGTEWSKWCDDTLRTTVPAFALLETNYKAANIAALKKNTSKLTEADKTAREAKAEILFKQIRAQRLMLERVVYSVFHARTLKAESVSDGQNGALVVYIPTGKKSASGSVIASPVTMSGTVMAKAGKEDFKKSQPAAKAKAKAAGTVSANNPGASTAQAFTVLQTGLEKVKTLPAAEAFGTTEDFNRNTEVFKTLCRMYFNDKKGDALLDIEVVREWLADNKMLRGTVKPKANAA